MHFIRIEYSLWRGIGFVVIENMSLWWLWLRLWRIVWRSAAFIALTALAARFFGIRTGTINVNVYSTWLFFWQRFIIGRRWWRLNASRRRNVATSLWRMRFSNCRRLFGGNTMVNEHWTNYGEWKSENKIYTVSAYPSSFVDLGIGSNDSVMRRLLLPYARELLLLFSCKNVSKGASGLVGDSTSLVCENASFTDNTLTFGTSVPK